MRLLLCCICIVAVFGDYYDVLGLSRDASAAKIKRAYRKLSLINHPDKNPGDEKAKKRFQDVAKAYQVLSDATTRITYDLEGEAGLKRKDQQQDGPTNPFDDVMGADEQKGKTVEVKLPVTLEELYNGVVKLARIKRKVPCRLCVGNQAQKTIKCSKCDGKGYNMVSKKMGPGFQVQMREKCKTCAGKGVVFKSTCKACNGKKVISEIKNIEAQIERGMFSGHRIVFEKHSNEQPGVVAGDIIFELKLLPHILFRREEHNLHYNLNITLREALVGFRKTISHLDNRKVVIRSSNITQAGSTKIIQGEGMPHHDFPSQKGDLYIQFTVWMPEKQWSQNEIAQISSVFP